MIFVYTLSWFALLIEITSFPSLAVLKAAAVGIVVTMCSAGANVRDGIKGFNPIARNIASVIDVRFWAETDTPCLTYRGRVQKEKREKKEKEVKDYKPNHKQSLPQKI